MSGGGLALPPRCHNPSKHKDSGTGDWADTPAGHAARTPNDAERRLSEARRLVAWEKIIRQHLAAGEHAKVTFERPSMTPAKTAESIGVSRATIMRRIISGEIRTDRKGNRHRIPLSEVERFRHTSSTRWPPILPSTSRVRVSVDRYSFTDTGWRRQ